jgi:zinc/manganese transport system substrate-binding protein
MSPISRGMLAAVPLTLLLAACGSHSHEPEPLAPPETTTSEEGRPVNVVVSTNILGDVVQNLVTCAGDGSVKVLMPAGADPHDFTPSSAQVADVVNADLVVINGLGLESGLESALDGASADGARIYAVAPWLDPIPFSDGHSDDHGDDHGDDHDHDHGSLDPHVWFDMQRMATATTLIATELGVVTGEQATYDACGAEFAADIRAAEADVRAALESVPAEQRVLVTDHEALGYLADLYGYEIAGTVIPAGTTLADPSSSDLATLASIMREEGVNVIFANVAEPTKLADAVAAEVGTDVRVVPIFVESLGEPGSPADTYIGMMQANAQLIAENLRR